MHLIRGIRNWPASTATVATIGNFDGVHLGHQSMFRRLKQISSDRSLPATVISFEPLPHEYFSRESAPGRLQGLRDRVASIASCGIDRLLLLKFDEFLAAESAEDFIQRVLVDCVSVSHLMIGDDFRFGHQRLGNVDTLRTAGEQHGFGVSSSETICVDDKRVSSSLTRQMLHTGDLHGAARLLGRLYRISGRVIHGEKVGRQLGFPTANVALKGQRPPLSGVFAVNAFDNDSTSPDEPLPAVANLGERPTVGGRKLLLEVHLLDRDAELYGHHLSIDLISHIRGEQRFGSLDELKAQIARDADSARAALADSTPASSR